MTNINTDWIATRLGDVAHVIHGWAFRGESITEPNSDLPVVVAIGNFDYSGGFRFESTTIKAYKGDYPAEYALSAGDLLLVMTCQTEGGEILGVPGRIPDDGQQYLHNQRLGRLEIHRPDLMDMDFAFQLMRSSGFNRQLFVTASGSKILHTSPKRVEQITFDRPPLSEQKAIAEVLGALDEKIAANTKLAISVDDFLAATFSQALQHELEIVELGEIATVNSTTVKPAPGASLRYLDIAGLRIGSHDWPELSPWDSAPSRARRGISAGDTIWSTVRPNRRSHSLVLSEDSSLVGSTGLAVLSPKEVGFAYLYELTKRDEFTAYLEKVAEGSAYPAVRASFFTQAPVPLLGAVERASFEQIAAPMRKQQYLLGMENATLAETRDTLLPQLMSGKLRVKDAQAGLDRVV
jgi:type I restriction enzyme S subunit